MTKNHVNHLPIGLDVLFTIQRTDQEARDAQEIISRSKTGVLPKDREIADMAAQSSKEMSKLGQHTLSTLASNRGIPDVECDNAFEGIDIKGFGRDAVDDLKKHRRSP